MPEKESNDLSRPIPEQTPNSTADNSNPTPNPIYATVSPNQRIEMLARKSLSVSLGISKDSFRIISSELVDWPDASLGCPKQGYLYAQVITNGYKLLFEYNETTYQLNTNMDGSNILICDTPSNIEKRGDNIRLDQIINS